MTRMRIVVACVAAAVLVIAITPAGAHVGGTVGHLWNQHLLPLAKKTFYTKAQSNARYVRRTSAIQHLIVTAPEWETDLGNDFQEIETSPSSGATTCLQLGAGGQVGYATVHLPQGARVSSIDVDFVDDGSEFGGDNAIVRLTREAIRGSGVTSTNLLTVTLPDGVAPGVYSTASASLATPAPINNGKAGYLLELVTSQAPHICNVDINYRVP
jgi:hypothetical protein